MLQLSDVKGHGLHGDGRLGLAPFHLAQVVREVSEEEHPLVRGPRIGSKSARCHRLFFLMFFKDFSSMFIHFQGFSGRFEAVSRPRTLLEA